MRTRAICGVTLLWLLTLAAAALADMPDFHVIVHPATRVASLDRDFVADVFLKRKTRWTNGQPIFPADQQGSGHVREHFSEKILHRSVAAVRSYWQQMVFSGRNVPPPEFKSDEEVIRYVSARPGAIGYVSASAAIGAATVVEVR